MKKKRMKRLLDEIDVNSMPHIFCPSYNRPDFVSAKMFSSFSEEAKKKVHIVVRSEQYKAYKKQNPDLQI